MHGTLSKTVFKSISKIVSQLPYGKSKVTDVLKAMNQKGIVKIEGKGKATKYPLYISPYAIQYV